MSDSKYVNTYVDEENKEYQQLEDDAHINRDTYTHFKYTFEPGTDITTNLTNNANQATKTNRKSGRIGYSPMTCTYPDGTSSKLVMIEKCVVQFRQGMESDKSSYGRDYVCIGFPDVYFDKIFLDARIHSSLDLGVKNEGRRLNGYYWIDCNLDKLAADRTYLVYLKDGESMGATKSLHSFLTLFGSSLEVSVLVSISASMTTTDVNIPLNLKGGKYHVTVKPHEAYILNNSDVVGPTTNAGRAKERVDGGSKRFIVTPAFLTLAIDRLKINDSD